MRPRLGLHLNPTEYREVLYAQACGVQFGRTSCYVANMMDHRYFSGPRGTDPWDQNDHPGQSPPAGYRRPVDWFYVEMKAWRDNGFQVVLTFHHLPGNDEYGTGLPQFIADIVRGSPAAGVPPSTEAFNMASPTRVVMAVQPGNENNDPNHETEYGPKLAGQLPHDRGVSHGNTIVATRAALDAANCRNVEVWTTGTTGGGTPAQQAFLEGVLDAPGALAATAGLCVHCYGFPPSNQVRDAGAVALAARTNKNSTAKIYATEVGSESLKNSYSAGADYQDYEVDGDLHVGGVLWWTLTYGTYYERIFWYTGSTDLYGLLTFPPPQDVPGRCGPGAARYPATGLNLKLCERRAGTTFRTWQG